MSAYAALRDNSSTSLAFSEGDEVNDELAISIKYDENSSDETQDALSDDYQYSIDEEPDSNPNEKRSYSPLDHVEYNFFNETSMVPELVNFSNFSPSQDNVICEGSKLILGLKEGEYILVRGQYLMEISMGSILLNRHHHLVSGASYKIFASDSQALPIIESSTRSWNADTHKSSDCIFGAEVISVVVLSDLNTGIENIGLYYPTLKDFFYNAKNDLNIQQTPKLGTKFFEVVLNDNNGVEGLNMDISWSDGINEVKRLLKESPVPKKIMVIGNKNTGKSTLSKALLNDLSLESSQAVSYFDLDPGQSEFSDPSTLSLTDVETPIWGLKIPEHNSSQIQESVTSHFYGYTSPVHMPSTYYRIVKSLFKVYEETKSNRHLIINTPGWIKGYGKEVLSSITDHIEPDILILLSSSPNSGRGENSDILNGLHFKRLIILRSMSKESKFTAAGLRDFNKLVYFHQKENLKFNFSDHLLSGSPFKITYHKEASDSYPGISALSFLKLDAEYDFDLDDIPLILESSMVGLYFVNDQTYQSIRKVKGKRTESPLYINYSDYEMLFNATDSTPIFGGLCMVHSINTIGNYLNLYIPEMTIARIRLQKFASSRVVLVRGDGDIPQIEMMNPGLVKAHESQVKKLNLQKKKIDNEVVDCIQKIPYMNFEKKRKIGGVWKVRRNIMRKSQQK